MPLTPQEIVRKEFREAFRGYNQSDVDLFLDEVVEEFGRLFEENQRLKSRIVALQQELGRVRSGRPDLGAGGGDADPRAIETEVRGRLKRFFEEQVRALEAAEQDTSMVERMRRDLAREPGRSDT